MATKCVTSVSHAASGIAGATRFTCSMTRSATPVTCGDAEVFASAVTTGGWEVTATMEGRDKENLQGLEGNASGQLIAAHPASDNTSGTAKTFTIENAVPNGYAETTPEPGEPGTSSISFNCSSADGSTAIIVITDV